MKEEPEEEQPPVAQLDEEAWLVMTAWLVPGLAWDPRVLPCPPGRSRSFGSCHGLLPTWWHLFSTATCRWLPGFESYGKRCSVMSN